MTAPSIECFTSCRSGGCLHRQLRYWVARTREGDLHRFAGGWPHCTAIEQQQHHSPCNGGTAPRGPNIAEAKRSLLFLLL